MDKPQHTPGPWTAFIAQNTVAVCIGNKTDGSFGHRPCVVNWQGFDSCDLPIEKQAANARLIAAAPDLLAALMALNKAYGHPFTGQNGNSGECWALARAAIAKAEGRAE